EGVWVLSSCEIDGIRSLPEEIRAIKLTIKGDRFITFNGNLNSYESRLAFPQQADAIDLATGQKIEKCIFKVDGKTLRICTPISSDQDRPKEFTGRFGSSQMLRVFERVSESIVITSGTQKKHTAAQIQEASSFPPGKGAFTKSPKTRPPGATIE